MTLRSEAEAERLILPIFSDAVPEPSVGQRCLAIFADAIAEANVYGRNTWAVTYEERKVRPERSKVRLVVNHIVVCTLGGGRIWMALDKGLLETSSYRSLLERSQDWEWGKGKWAEYREIPARNGYYRPSENHAEIWPKIRRLHFESIYRAVEETTMDPRTPQRHSPGILKYLRNQLGRHVPDPRY
jgi:hypothetical protein